MENNNPQPANPYGQPVNPYAQPGNPYGPAANPYIAEPQGVYPNDQTAAPAFNVRAHRKFFSRVGMSYFVLLIITFVIQIAIRIVVELAAPELMDIYLLKIIFALAPMYLVGAPAAYLMLRRLPAESPERDEWSPLQYIGGFFIAYGVMYVGNFIGTYLGMIIEAFVPDASASTNEVQNLVLTGEMWVNILFMVFVGPVVEELLFRKMLCDRLRTYGEKVTVILSGLMFGLFHGNLTQGVYAFLLGCIFAYVYLKTGKILITISYHIIINFCGSVIPLLALSSLDLEEFSRIFEEGDLNRAGEYILTNAPGLGLYFGYLAFAMVGMILGIILLIVTAARGRIVMKPGRITIPSGKKFAVIVINAGMILFFAINIFSIIASMFA